MVDSRFTPEMTSPHIDQATLRLRLLSTIFCQYPDSVTQFLKAWPYFDQLSSQNEDGLHEGVKGIKTLEVLAERWAVIGATPLFVELEKWAQSINLKTLWTVVAGMRILRWIQMDKQSDQTPSRYDVSKALAKLQADLCLIPVTNAPSTNAAGIFGVILPRFMPTRQSEADYKAECEKILSGYISRELHAHTAEGLNKPKPLRAEERHLNWLSWMLVEKLTSFEVAVRQEKETPTKSKNNSVFVPDDDKVKALFKPGGLATVIGLSRN